MRLRGLLGSCLIVLAAAHPATAQRAPIPAPPVDSAALVTLRLTDGTELTGRVVARDDTSLVVVTIAGLRVVTPRRVIAGWRAQRGRIAAGRFVEADPNTSRLFFAPTGRTLAAGSGYFADYFLFFPFVAVGLTNRVTLAGGMSILPGADNQLVYIAPKIGLVQSPRLNVAAGGIYATVPGETGSIGAVYGVGTFGSEDNAVTVVAGYPFADGETTDGPSAVLGGEARISGRSKFLVEAWLLPGAEVVPATFGLRFFGSRLTVDFGLMSFIGADTEGFPFFPWVDFVVSF
ncbi:MAG: hypothetical protein HYR48_08045 [Gemmatimonadetes bacterium]|nr:hypothetical protein [Gemmatimonadota bacterium]